MSASALHWAIAKSRIPATLKKTLFALALVADPEQGFSNIYFSKRQIGQFSGKGERQAREDMSDLVRFGVLTVVDPSPGRRTSRYKLHIERLGDWSPADTFQLSEFRRIRRPSGREKGEGQPGSGDPRQPGSGDPGLRRKNARSTRIGRSGQPGSGDPANPDRAIRRSVQVISTSDSTVAERGTTTAPAVENSAASGAVSPGSVPRPTDGAVYLDPKSNYRHRGASSNRRLRSGSSEARSHSTYYATPNEPQPDGPIFQILSEIGRTKLAGYGTGEVDWSELHADLRSCLGRFGREDLVRGDFLNRVVDSLQAQRAHFLAAAKGGGAPPTPNVAPRSS